MRINLRGHQAFVAQKLLHAADVGPPVQQVRGKTVPQRMRRGAAVQPAKLQVFFQHPPYAPRGQAPSEFVDEHRRRRTRRLARTEFPHAQPPPQRPHGVRTHRREPLAPPLAADPRALRPRNPCRRRLVPPPRSPAARPNTWFPGSPGREFPSNHYSAEIRASAPMSSAERKCGSERPLRRIPQRLGRIRFRPTFALPKAKKTPQRRQAPCNRRLGVARLVHRRHVPAQIEHRDVAGQGRLTARRLSQIFRQPAEILAVTLQRVIRGVPLHAQILQKSVDGELHGYKLSVLSGQLSAISRRPLALRFCAAES